MGTDELLLFEAEVYSTKLWRAEEGLGDYGAC
jgi:hypothetical protein